MMRAAVVQRRTQCGAAWQVRATINRYPPRPRNCCAWQSRPRELQVTRVVSTAQSVARPQSSAPRCGTPWTPTPASSTPPSSTASTGEKGGSRKRRRAKVLARREGCSRLGPGLPGGGAAAGAGSLPQGGKGAGQCSLREAHNAPASSTASKRSPLGHTSTTSFASPAPSTPCFMRCHILRHHVPSAHAHTL